MISRVILLLLCSLLVVRSAQLTYPLKVAYLDQVDCCSPENTILEAVAAGFNVIVLAFYQTATGPADAALAWSERIDAETRTAALATIHAAGAVLTVSLGGSNDQMWESADATQLATKIANWANEYQLDGVDFDLEHFGGFGAINGDDDATIAWFSTLITTTRQILGPDGIISMAPLPPWFGPIGAPKCTTSGQLGCSWVGPSGGLTAVDKLVGDEIDYYFAQFYNQGACYTTEAGLFTESGPGCTTGGAYYPYTSIKEINEGGIPLSKIVMGKPVDNANSAASGFVDPATIKSWIASSGKALGWNTGVGIWEWLDVSGSVSTPWLNAVYPGSSKTLSTSAPTVAAGPTPPSVTSTRPPAPTTAPTQAATQAPTLPPTQPPTNKPTTQPTPAPTTKPSHGHHKSTQAPTTAPVATAAPTNAATAPPTSPPTQSSSSSSDDAVCTSGYMKCTGTGSYSSCANGVWQADQLCQTGLSCVEVSPYIYCL